MKYVILGVLLLAGIWALAQAPAAPGALAGYMPSGALLYLEARDFSTLLRGWNASAEKRMWLASDNYEVFSRSRLFERLDKAQDEFAAAAGLPPDLALLESVAGSESAIAIYDIGELQFLYITRLASAKAMENALWQTRSKFETRSAAGQNFYIRTDKGSHRTVGFAATGGFLVLGTREDLIAGALMFIAGQSGPNVKQEGWYDQPVHAAAPPGDLRLVLNMQGLVRSPHFRSYWIQRNVSALRPYQAGISDLRRLNGEYREDRLLLRVQPAEAPPASAALAQLQRLAPDDAGLYRVWSAPDVNAAVRLLEAKVLAPRAGSGVPSRFAPVVTEQGDTGSAADLETRIDEPPFQDSSTGFDRAPLTRLLAAAKLEGMLQVESTRLLPDRVFVRTESAIALLAANDWPAAPAFAGAFVAVRGKLLFFATREDVLNSLVTRVRAPAGGETGVYAAVFRHSRERATFERLTRAIDHPQLPPGKEHEPPFFSGNLASLSRTLARVDSESIVVRDTGAGLSQTVVYRFKP